MHSSRQSIAHKSARLVPSLSITKRERCDLWIQNAIHVRNEGRASRTSIFVGDNSMLFFNAWWISNHSVRNHRKYEVSTRERKSPVLNTPFINWSYFWASLVSLFFIQIEIRGNHFFIAHNQRGDRASGVKWFYFDLYRSLRKAATLLQ